MNKSTLSTSPLDAPAKAERVASAMLDLESNVRELMHMSYMAAEIYDDYGLKTAEDANSVTYRCTRHEMDLLAFLVNNVASRAHDLSKRYHAAWKGESVQ